MALAQAFKEGHLERMASLYHYPLAIYSPSGLWLEANARETVEIVFRRRVAAIRAGMSDLRVTIGKPIEDGAERIRVNVAWDFVKADGTVFDRSRLRYFCRRDPDGQLRVEMIEFSQLAFAEA
jgi:hypothetical protein